MGKSFQVGVAFGIAVRKIRLARKLTQEQLGFEAGLRRTYISSIELGDKQPSLKTIYSISKAFGIPMSKLLQQTEKEIDPKTRE